MGQPQNPSPPATIILMGRASFSGCGHRALADIIESLDELRYYRKAFMAPVPGPSEAEAKAIASEIQETSLLNKD